MIGISQHYRKPFYFALGLHLLLIILLGMEHSNQSPVLTLDTKNTPGFKAPLSEQPQIVKAVSVDHQELTKAVEKLKREREKVQQAQINKQKELEHQATLAKQQRIKEEQRLVQLKEEANKIAILRKKQAIEEQKRLKELAEQKALESKRLKELQAQKEQLQKQRALEEQKRIALSKKKAEEKAEEKARTALEDAKKKEEARALDRRIQAENQARLKGVVDKYRALIQDAIGRNWILPENADKDLSSQFTIHLAPDGTVLDVFLMRSSGDTLLDRSAQTAIYKASPLPVPVDKDAFDLFRTINLTVRPEQVRG